MNQLTLTYLRYNVVFVMCSIAIHNLLETIPITYTQEPTIL